MRAMEAMEAMEGMEGIGGMTGLPSGYTEVCARRYVHPEETPLQAGSTASQGLTAAIAVMETILRVAHCSRRQRDRAGESPQPPAAPPARLPG